MSFIAKNPLTIPKVSKAPSAPIQGARGLFAKEDGWYDIDDSGNERKIISEDDLSAEIPEVVDNLTSTDTDKALSANQGNKLEYSKISYDLAYDEKPGDLDNLVPEADTFYNTTDKWYYTTTRFGNVMGRIREYLYARNMQPMPLEATDKYNDALQIMIKGEDICKRVRTRHSNSNGSLTYTWSEWHPYLTRAEAFEKLCPTGSAESLTSSLTLADGCGGTNVRNYVIHGAEGGVGDLNSDTGKYEIPVTVRGKNLMSIERDVRHEYASGVIVEKGADYVIAQMRASAENINPGSTSNSSGWVGLKPKNSGTSEFNNCVFKDIKPGTTYTLSYNFEYFYLPENVSKINHLCFVRVNNTNYTQTAYDISQINKRRHNKLTFTTPETISSMELFFSLNSCKVKLSNIMLEEGGNKTEYERYAEPQTAVIELSAPLGTNDHVVNASGTTYKNSALSKASTAEIPLVASGTNIIEVGTATAPGKIEVEYYKDINKIVNNLTNAILAQGGNV